MTRTAEDHAAHARYFAAASAAARECPEYCGDWLAFRELARAATTAQVEAESLAAMHVGGAIKDALARIDARRRRHGAKELAKRLAEIGCRLRLDGDTLLVGPRERITPELRTQIQEHKRELMEVA